MVNVVAPHKAMMLFTDPLTEENRRSHFVYAFGILFSLITGRTVTYEIRPGCFASNLNHPIMVFDGLTEQFENQLKGLYFRAPKSRKLIEAKKTRDAQRTACTFSPE
jgi:hypothetical protein